MSRKRGLTFYIEVTIVWLAELQRAFAVGQKLRNYLHAVARVRNSRLESFGNSALLTIYPARSTRLLKRQWIGPT